MKSSLDYKKDFLCVLAEFEVLDGPHTAALMREWYPVHRAEEVEVRTLLGRPVTKADSDEGIYLDEEGNVFQLAEQGRTQPIEVERSSAEGKEVGDARAEASPADGIKTLEDAANENHRSKRRKERRPKIRRKAGAPRGNSPSSSGAHCEDGPRQERQDFAAETVTFAQLNLRQKLAVVRRRIGYIQKRGLNERFNYSYVKAADIAGAVGDILAELGVVVIPKLESISYEPARSGRTEAERAARVVMAYSFIDVDTGEGLTVKTAGEGLDPGDKAPYKAMTGALKYALLQSFLLATGDDPEDEHADSRTALGSERVITPEQARELQRLVEQTGTELDRVLAYYRISALSEMTEASYLRARELLNRKLAKQGQESGAHAQN